ncbi:MAG: hypothetical protein WA323_20885, partial [Candidatus Nitrosopolaris sp.]
LFLPFLAFVLCLIFGSTHMPNNDSKFLSPSYALSALNIDPASVNGHRYVLLGKVLSDLSDSCD